MAHQKTDSKKRTVKRSWSKLKRHFKRLRSQQPGTLPGQLSAPEGAHPTRVRWTRYTPAGVASDWVQDIEQVRTSKVANEQTWIEVCGLQNQQWLEALGKRFQVHPLVMEDVSNSQHSPKLDVYENNLFIVLRLITNADPCETEQLSIYLTERTLISFHEQESRFSDLIHERILQRLGRLRDSGVDFLAYAIIDALVDTNYLVADTLAQRIELLEDEVATTNFSDDLLQSIRSLRHDLLLTRRTIWPIRDVLNQLIRDQYSLVQPETRTFLKDCYDHAIQLIDLVEVYREMCADLRDYYLSMINLRANEIMKVLTIIATIFMPLGFIAGLYGMNFDRSSAWNMPELGWSMGYPAVLLFMLAITLGMLYYFRTRRWI